MDPTTTAVLCFLALMPVLYMYTVGVVATRFPALRNKRICLLIAHPDDEAMFFAPTMLALTRPETGNHVKILCLSTGNAAGLGETRRKELIKSGMTLGLRDEEDVFVLDRPNDFPDSMTETWEEAKISKLLTEAFAPQLERQRASDSAKPTANIDVIITFDETGVSSHPNHISLYHGARAFVGSLVKGKPGWTNPVDLYTLSSVNMLRKYTFFYDMFATLATFAMSVGKANKDRPPTLVFMNQLAGEGALGTAWSAMTTAHKSQMVWFRYLWIGFSRYMLMNDLKREKV